MGVGDVNEEHAGRNGPRSVLVESVVLRSHGPLSVVQNREQVAGHASSCLWACLPCFRLESKVLSNRGFCVCVCVCVCVFLFIFLSFILFM